MEPGPLGSSPSPLNGPLRCPFWLKAQQGRANWASQLFLSRPPSSRKGLVWRDLGSYCWEYEDGGQLLGPGLGLLLGCFGCLGWPQCVVFSCLAVFRGGTPGNTRAAGPNRRQLSVKFGTALAQKRVPRPHWRERNVQNLLWHLDIFFLASAHETCYPEL